MNNSTVTLEWMVRPLLVGHGSFTVQEGIAFSTPLLVNMYVYVTYMYISKPVFKGAIARFSVYGPEAK